MNRHLRVALQMGVPFGLFMGMYQYSQHHNMAAFLIGLSGGVFFGSAMAWYQARAERRLQRLGLSAADMKPVQARSIAVPLDVDAALQKAAQALSSVRKLKSRSVDVTSGKITAKTGMTWQSLGERLTVEVVPSESGSLVHISSQPRVATTTMDGGKGRENVELFERSLTREA